MSKLKTIQSGATFSEWCGLLNFNHSLITSSSLLTFNSSSKLVIQDGVLPLEAFASDFSFTPFIPNVAIKSSHIANDSIEKINFAINSVQGLHLTANSVTSIKFALQSLVNLNFKSGAINSSHLAPNAVTDDRLILDSITGDRLAIDFAATGIKFAANSITSEKILNGSISTNDKITNGSLTTEKLGAAVVKTRAFNELNSDADTEFRAVYPIRAAAHFKVTVDVSSTGWYDCTVTRDTFDPAYSSFSGGASLNDFNIESIVASQLNFGNLRILVTYNLGTYTDAVQQGGSGDYVPSSINPVGFTTALVNCTCDTDMSKAVLWKANVFRSEVFTGGIPDSNSPIAAETATQSAAYTTTPIAPAHLRTRQYTCELVISGTSQVDIDNNQIFNPLPKSSSTTFSIALLIVGTEENQPTI